MRLLAFPDLKQAKGWPYSRVQTWRLVKNGKCPAPIMLGGKCLWSEQVWDAHFAALFAAKASAK